MSRPLARRLSRLERPETRDPVMEDWLDVLDAEDPIDALALLTRRYPNVSAHYKRTMEALA